MSDISASLAALTASLQDNGLGATLEALTGELVGVQGPIAILDGELVTLTGDFASPGNGDGILSARLERLSIEFQFPATLDGSLEPVTAEFVGDPGLIGSILSRLEALTGSFDGTTPHLGTLAGTLQARTSSLQGLIVAEGTLSGALRRLQFEATGVLGAIGSIDATFERLTAVLTGSPEASGTMSLLLPAMWGSFSGEENLAAGLDAWAINTRTNAVTSYPAYPANSLARYNGTYLAAGPSGLILLDSSDALESGTGWRIRTGQLDDKRATLKRLTELLLALRYDGPVNVRIWRDDETYYDYALPNRRANVLHQVRAKPGRGSRSRYYKIELSGTGRLELDSLQATMPDTSRRIG